MFICFNGCFNNSYTPGWTFTRCGEGFEKTLLVEFDRVIDAFLDLKPEYQAVIQDITQRMGDGMAEFLNKKVDSMQDWDRYCYYVAGLVGIGLSKVWGGFFVFVILFFYDHGSVLVVFCFEA